MQVILEGPDGSGKTTLAKRLVAEHGLRYVHHGLYPDDTGQQLLQRYAGSILASEGTILDRCFLSEYTYGTVLRSKDRLGELGRVLLTRLCRARGVTEVICLPNLATVEANWRAKINDYVKEATQLHALYGMYSYLAKDPARLLFNYVWDHPKYEDLFNHKLETDPPWLPSWMVGSPQARILFIGDQVNVNKAWVDLPFFHLSGVSQYLYENLKATYVQERDVAFMNCKNLRGDYNPHSFNSLSYLNKVIALGEEAAEYCRDHRIAFKHVPHPNFWMRFRHKKRQEYVELLREAIYQ